MSSRIPSVLAALLLFRSISVGNDLGQRRLYDTLTFYAQTSDSSGAETNAASPPAYRVYEVESGAPILTGLMTALDPTNTVGFYSETIELSPANGFERGKQYAIRFRATVSSVNMADFHTFTLHPNEILIQHNGNNATSGATAEARIEAATAGAVVILSAGVFDMGSAQLLVPDDVTIRGAGIDATHFKSSIGSDFVIPGDRSLIEFLTIENSSQAPIGTSGSQQFSAAVVRNARLIGNGDCVHIDGTQASSITIERVWMDTDFDGIVVDNAAHNLWLRDVFITGKSEGGPGVCQGIIIGGATHLRGTRVSIDISTAPGAAGGISVTDNSVLELFDSGIYVDKSSVARYSVNVSSVTAKARLVNCEYDRSLESGETARIEDTFSRCDAP